MGHLDSREIVDTIEARFLDLLPSEGQPGYIEASVSLGLPGFKQIETTHLFWVDLAPADKVIEPYQKSFLHAVYRTGLARLGRERYVDELSRLSITLYEWPDVVEPSELVTTRQIDYSPSNREVLCLDYPKGQSYGWTEVDLLQVLESVIAGQQMRRQLTQPEADS